MIVPKSKSKYMNRRKLVMDRGFIDLLSSIFNSIKPMLQYAGSFISENDLIKMRK